MPKYLFAVHTSATEPPEPITAEEMRAGFKQLEAIEGEMRAANGLLFSGRLVEPAQARVVRARRGRIQATDGPFLETKEHLGGFYIVEAMDDATALDWASKVTVAINAPIEVRPFAEEPSR